MDTTATTSTVTSSHTTLGSVTSIGPHERTFNICNIITRMAAETRHEPVLSRITSRIRKKRLKKLFQGGKALQRNKILINDRTWSDLK